MISQALGLSFGYGRGDRLTYRRRKGDPPCCQVRQAGFPVAATARGPFQRAPFSFPRYQMIEPDLIVWPIRIFASHALDKAENPLRSGTNSAWKLCVEAVGLTIFD